MSNLEFEEEKFKSPVIFGQSKTPKMVSFLIKKGIVKSEKTAGTFLMVLSLVFFSLSIFIFVYFVLGIKTFSRSSQVPNNLGNLPPEIRAQIEGGATLKK